MDENLESSSSPLLIFDGEEEEEIVCEDFYEKIEAPKFVDFTAPQRCRPDDDRYWFCVRAGCDRKHEEEIDPEAIYRNFVFRVMAARSPNVKLQRTVNRKYLSTNVKCPHTAPPKSSRTRASRLEMISSVSQKIADTKAMDVGLPKNNNKVVVKALDFQSPKKLDTPMRKICAGMKKLEITSQRKNVLGYNNPLLLDTSRKKLRGREVKSRVFDCLLPQKSKGREVKSSRLCLKEDIKKFKQCDLAPCEDEKLMNSSLDVHTSGNMFAKRRTVLKPREPLSDNSDDYDINCDETMKSGSDNYKENNSEVMEGDDKENSSAPNDIRKREQNQDHTKRKIPGKHKNSKCTQKIIQVFGKTTRDTGFATSGVQVVKYRKPKPTNPKPCRLRTDERQILKEANMERKLHNPPLKEIPGIARTQKTTLPRNQIPKASTNVQVNYLRL